MTPLSIPHLLPSPTYSTLHTPPHPIPNLLRGVIVEHTGLQGVEGALQLPVLTLYLPILFKNGISPGDIVQVEDLPNLGRAGKREEGRGLVQYMQWQTMNTVSCVCIGSRFLSEFKYVFTTQ